MGHGGVEGYGEGEITQDGFDWVGDRVVVLADEVGHQHAYSIAAKAAPGAGYIAIARYEDDVDGQQDSAAAGRHDGAPPCFGYQLVPERQVEIDAHEYFGHHHDRHCAEPIPVVALDDVAQQVHIAHHGQEGQQGEHDEIFHHNGLTFFALLVAAVAEDERLIGVAERLGDHGHDHGYLDAGTVDGQLFVALDAGYQETEAYLVGHLVEDACQA